MASGVARIAEQVRRILGKRDADSDIDERELQLAVRQAISYIVRMRFWESKGQDYPEVPESLIMTYQNLKIESDALGLFTTLPSRVIDLPYGMGIKLVAAQSNPQCGFFRQPNGFNSISCGLESNCVPGQNYYFQDGNKLRYPNLGHEDNPGEIFIRLVAPAEDIENEDELQIPPDMESDVLDRVLAVYGAFRPQDEVNDQDDII